MLYVRGLELTNVRCFGKKQHIDFTVDGNIAQWNVILGDNGAGKTTLLKSIVSLLPSPRYFSYRRHHLETEYELSYYTDWAKEWSINRNGVKGKSVMKLEIEETEKAFKSDKLNFTQWLEIEREKREDDLFDFYPKPSVDTRVISPVFCFAYGANRKVAPNSLSGDKYQDANQTLFREDAFLQSSEEFFLQLDYNNAKARKGDSEISRVKDLILKLLPKGVKDIKVVRKGHLQREVQVETPYGWVSINELSMGYKTTIAWLIDFAVKMIYYNPNSEQPFNQPAILVIDEIDLHMHPAWQYEIVANLTKLFPKTQFIVTAHSPLIAQAALNANLILLRRVGKEVQVVNDPNVVRSWRVDQILISDLFGIGDVRPLTIKNLLNEKERILSKDELNERDKKKLTELDKKIGDLPYYDNPTEKRAYNALDKITEILNRKPEQEQEQ